MEMHLSLLHLKIDVHFIRSANVRCCTIYTYMRYLNLATYVPVYVLTSNVASLLTDTMMNRKLVLIYISNILFRYEKQTNTHQRCPMISCPKLRLQKHDPWCLRTLIISRKWLKSRSPPLEACVNASLSGARADVWARLPFRHYGPTLSTTRPYLIRPEPDLDSKSESRHHVVANKRKHQFWILVTCKQVRNLNLFVLNKMSECVNLRDTTFSEIFDFNSFFGEIRNCELIK